MRIVAALLLFCALLFSVAVAHDLSTLQCTASDVEIVGIAQVINEPCTCTGTFPAQVQFTVRNNAMSERGCITLHLVTVVVGGVTFQGRDIFLNNKEPIAGKTTLVVTETINNYPCGAGLLCFGSTTADGKKRCEPGECPTVSWTVPGQDPAICPPERQISSKCRHQQICIQGRGSTNVDCDLDTTGIQTNCPIPCGTSTSVRVCTTGGVGPFTFTLTAVPSVEISPDEPVTTEDTCVTFTVGGITVASVALTGSVTDSGGCTKSATNTLTTTPVDAPELSLNPFEECSADPASVTIVATNIPGATYTWFIDGDEDTSSTTFEFQYPQTLDAECHVVTALYTTADNCESPLSDGIPLSQCISTTLCVA